VQIVVVLLQLQPQSEVWSSGVESDTFLTVELHSPPAYVCRHIGRKRPYKRPNYTTAGIRWTESWNYLVTQIVRCTCIFHQDTAAVRPDL